MQWYAPLSDWIKFNTDGTANDLLGLAGCGGTFRTYRGFCKGCFLNLMRILFAYATQLMGIICAIEFVKKHNWNFLCFQSDSIYVVNLLSTQKPTNLMALFVTLKSGFEFFGQYHVWVLHIFREGNYVIDRLASHAVSLQDATWWFNSPPFFVDAVMKDIFCK